MTKNSISMPPAMILCGGRGTRLRDVTEVLPKPMVPIGEQPIVWHVMKSYAAFGVRRFILCLGYKREAFVDYFMNYHLRTSDATITLGTEEIPAKMFELTAEDGTKSYCVQSAKQGKDGDFLDIIVISPKEENITQICTYFKGKA